MISTSGPAGRDIHNDAYIGTYNVQLSCQNMLYVCSTYDSPCAQWQALSIRLMLGLVCLLGYIVGRSTQAYTTSHPAIDEAHAVSGSERPRHANEAKGKGERKGVAAAAAAAATMNSMT